MVAADGSKESGDTKDEERDFIRTTCPSCGVPLRYRTVSNRITAPCPMCGKPVAVGRNSNKPDQSKEAHLALYRMISPGRFIPIKVENRLLRIMRYFSRNQFGTGLACGLVLGCVAFYLVWVLLGAGASQRGRFVLTNTKDGEVLKMDTQTGRTWVIMMGLEKYPAVELPVKSYSNDIELQREFNK